MQSNSFKPSQYAIRFPDINTLDHYCVNDTKHTKSNKMLVRVSCCLEKPIKIGMRMAFCTVWQLWKPDFFCSHLCKELMGYGKRCILRWIMQITWFIHFRMDFFHSFAFHCQIAIIRFSFFCVCCVIVYFYRRSNVDQSFALELQARLG